MQKSIPPNLKKVNAFLFTYCSTTTVTRASGLQRTDDAQLVYGFEPSLTRRSHDAGVSQTLSLSHGVYPSTGNQRGAKA